MAWSSGGWIDNLAVARYHRRMAHLLVGDIPRDIVEALNARAAARSRSAEAEHRLILEEALRPGRRTFRERAASLRQATAGRLQGESADLVRADRDTL